MGLEGAGWAGSLGRAHMALAPAPGRRPRDLSRLEASGCLSPYPMGGCDRQGVAW